VTALDVELTDPTRSAEQMRRWAAISLFVAMVLAGLRWADPAHRVGNADLVDRVVLSLLVTFWVHCDSRVVGRRPVHIAMLGMFLLPQVGLPVYCLWSRGRAGWLLILKFLGWATLAALPGVILGT